MRYSKRIFTFIVLFIVIVNGNLAPAKTNQRAQFLLLLSYYYLGHIYVMYIEYNFFSKE